MERQKKFYIQTKTKECYPFDVWLTKLEMRAFGWRDRGIESEFDGFDISIDEDARKATASTRFKYYLVFKRVKPYSSSFLFNFMETIMSIGSWIRRKLIALLMGLIIICVGIGIIEMILMPEGSDAAGLLGGAFIMLAVIYGPSIVTAIFGFLFRTVTDQDEKLKRRLAQNGYSEEQDF